MGIWVYCSACRVPISNTEYTISNPLFPNPCTNTPFPLQGRKRGYTSHPSLANARVRVRARVRAGVRGGVRARVRVIIRVGLRV